jgi:hypothetical protein
VVDDGEEEEALKISEIREDFRGKVEEGFRVLFFRGDHKVIEVGDQVRRVTSHRKFVLVVERVLLVCSFKRSFLV